MSDDPPDTPNADARYTITRATLADLDTVVDIYEETSRWLVARGIADQWRPGEYTAAMARHTIAQAEVYLAWRASAAVGKCSLMWDDPQVWGAQPPDAGYVHGLATRRSEAGRGLGATLLRYAAHRIAANSRQYLRLDCAANNQALRDYYERLGFTHRGDTINGEWGASLYERRVESKQ